MNNLWVWCLTADLNVFTLKQKAWLKKVNLTSSWNLVLNGNTQQEKLALTGFCCKWCTVLKLRRCPLICLHGQIHTSFCAAKKVKNHSRAACLDSLNVQSSPIRDTGGMGKGKEDGQSDPELISSLPHWLFQTETKCYLLHVGQSLFVLHDHKLDYFKA